MKYYRFVIRLFLTVLIALCFSISLTASTAVAAVDEITSLPFVSQGVIPFPDRNGPFHPIKWNPAQFPGARVPFVLNPNSPAGVLASLPPVNLIIDAVRAALQSWEDVATATIAFDLQTPSSAPASGRLDGVSLLTFADPGDDLDPATIAATSIFALETPGPATIGPVTAFVDFPGEIIETDLVFNPRVPFATDGNLSAFDIQGIATHELGHAVGRDHTAIITATMFTVAERGNLRERNLTSDDIGGLSAVHPNEPSFSSSFGSISGAVRSGGSPVLGAHLVAVNANGDPVVSALTFPNGTYTIVGLPPGQYKVYAEPTDGPVDPDSYDLGVLFPFSPAFNTVLKPDLVTVAAGANVANVDFDVTSPAPINLTGITPFDPNIFLPVAPVGLLVERGRTLEAELVSSGLRQGITISFDGPGIGSVEIINFLDPNPLARFSGDSSVDFRAAIDANAPLGPRNVVVRNAQGGMAILPGAITIVEQGSLPPPPPPPTSGGGAITPGQTVTGSIASSGQRDQWTFQGQRGDRVTITMNATAGSFLDTFLELLGTDGRQLTLDDDSGPGLNSLISNFILPATGAYTVIARGFQTSTGAYNLTLQLTPAGQLPPGEGPDGGVIRPGQVVTGNISAPGERDSWTFQGHRGDRVTIRMNATAGSLLDTFLNLLDPNGTVIAEDDDGGPGLNSLISDVILSLDGTYTIIAKGFSTSTGEYNLLLELQPATPTPPTGAGLNPRLSFTINTTSFRVGDTLNLDLNLIAGTQNPPVELYIGAMLPDGSFLFMTRSLFNPFVPNVTPFLSNFTVQDTTLNIINTILPEGSQGHYVVIAASVTAGSPLEIFNLIDVDRVEFVIQ